MGASPAESPDIAPPPACPTDPSMVGHAVDPDCAPTTGPLRRLLWCAGGFSAVALGGVGMIVPGLPTTIFFIIAAWCFGHGSPRFERWVLNLPGIGPLVRDHRLGLGMPRRAKVIANVMMWTAIALSAVVLWPNRWVIAGIVALGTVGTVYIVFQVPTRETELARRAALVEADLA